MLYGRPIPVARIVQGISDRTSFAIGGQGGANELGAQNNTQMYGKRPYGVGFLVIGQDVGEPFDGDKSDADMCRRLDHTFSSSPPREPLSSTMPIRSVLEVRAQRPIWKRTLRALRMVGLLR
jgi:hypothetical protein